MSTNLGFDKLAYLNKSLDKIHLELAAIRKHLEPMADTEAMRLLGQVDVSVLKPLVRLRQKLNEMELEERTKRAAG